MFLMGLNYLLFIYYLLFILYFYGKYKILTFEVRSLCTKYQGKVSKINLNLKLEKLKFLLSLLTCILCETEPLLDKVIKLNISLTSFSQYFSGLGADPSVWVVVGKISLNWGKTRLGSVEPFCKAINCILNLGAFIANVQITRGRSKSLDKHNCKIK